MSAGSEKQEDIFQQFSAQLNKANQEKQKLEKLKKQAFQQIQEVTKAAKGQLDGQCAELLAKQKQIDEYIKKILNNQQLMQKQVNSWTELIKKFNEALKNMGDAAQTASVIYQDLQEINTIVQQK